MKRAVEKTGGKKKKRKKAGGAVKKVLYVVILVIVAAGALAIVVYKDDLNIDALRRYIRYMNVDIGDDGQTEEFYYGDSTGTCFAPLGRGMVAASPSGFSYFSEGGAEDLSAEVQMDNPAIESSDDTAVVYDLGGDYLAVINKYEIELELSEGLTIISADVNDGGWMAVTAQESGYKSVVGVYDADMREVYKWYSSSRYIMDACVSPDSSTLAVASIGQEDDVFTSKISFYKLDQETEYASCSLEDSLILDLSYMEDGSICAVAEDRLLFSDDGGDTASFDYSDEYLKDYSLDGDGFAVLVLNKYKAGSRGEIITVETGGEKLAGLEINEEVASVSAAGRYVAVLTAGGLNIYDKDFNIYAKLDDTKDVADVIMRDDGTVVLIGDQNARLYIP